MADDKPPPKSEKGKGSTGGFVRSVRDAFDQVFRHADLEEILDDGWSFSDSTESSLDGPGPLEGAVQAATTPPPAPGGPESQEGQEPIKAGQTLGWQEHGADNVDGTPQPPQDPPPAPPVPAKDPAIDLLTEVTGPDLGSFFESMAFGQPDAPYPISLPEGGGSSETLDSMDIPSPRDTLDITGTFDDFLLSDDDAFEEMDGSPVRLDQLATDVEPAPTKTAAPSPVRLTAQAAAPATQKDDGAALEPEDAKELPQADAFSDPAPQGRVQTVPSSPAPTEVPQVPEEEEESLDLDQEAPSNSLLSELVMDDESWSEGQLARSDVDTLGDSTRRDDPLLDEDTGRREAALLSLRKRAGKAAGSSMHGPPPKVMADTKAIRAELAAELRREGRAAEDAEMQVLLEDLRQLIETDQLDLPPFPPSAQRLLGQVSEEEIMEIIEQSPSLAGNVVKIANSPFYMSAKPVASLPAAVMRIGLDQVRRVSLAALVGSSYHVEGFDSVISRVQLHSFATAIAAELIAPWDRQDAGEAFLAGLLHDAGMVLTYRLVRRVLEAQKRDWTPEPRMLRALARRYHQRLGALFLEGWDLPPGVAATMAFHHHPEDSPEAFTDIVRLVHVADALSERAIRHSKSPAWKVGMAHRGPDATAKEWERAAVLDGIGEVGIGDLMLLAPRRATTSSLQGVIRSVLLKLDSRRYLEMSQAGEDTQ